LSRDVCRPVGGGEGVGDAAAGVVNEILASGATAGRQLNQTLQIFRNPDGTVTPWQLQLQVQGETDYYSQHLVLSPGGYSGWHSHPGLLIGTVVSGQIDFYNARCRKRTTETGQVFTETTTSTPSATPGTSMLICSSAIW
jgi:quercetin dioxygenase-like cupin family protein